jgi:phage FluMu protein Com
MQQVDIHCPVCRRTLLKHFDGAHVQVPCRHCKLEVVVKRRLPVPTPA